MAGREEVMSGALITVIGNMIKKVVFHLDNISHI